MSIFQTNFMVLRTLGNIIQSMRRVKKKLSQEMHDENQ
jgi:hypothetical protein